MSASPSSNLDPELKALFQIVAPKLASELIPQLMPRLTQEMEHIIPRIVGETLLQSKAMNERENKRNTPNGEEANSGAETPPPMEQVQNALPQVQPQHQPSPLQQDQPVAAVPPLDERVSDEVIVAKVRENKRLKGVFQTREVRDRGLGASVAFKPGGGYSGA